jgi:hypothetical protein
MDPEPVGIDPANANDGLRPVDIDGPELAQLGARYRERSEISEDEWEDVVATAARALAHCPDPAGPARRVTGLALGKVQSGKTLSYTNLIALGVDNGYRITVALAGTKNPLRLQTYNRLVHDLGAGQGRVIAFDNPLPQDAEVIRRVLHGGGHALIVSLKQRQRLDNVRRILETPELRNFATLVIDDEGDEASLNTQFRRGNQSAVYQSIVQLRNALPLHAFVAYTATPQANLLIEGIDALSPDFALLVEPGGGYCGGSVFFGDDIERYVRPISADDGDPHNAAAITPGLMQATATFLVGAAIRSLREDDRQLSMLLHTTHYTAQHRQLHTAVQELIRRWEETARLRDADPEKADLLTLMRAAYDDLSQTVADPPTWDAVRGQLGHEVLLTEVWMVNSLPLGRDPVATPFRLRNNILVGGNMLGRGVTIPGLAVTYITREAQQDTNADTLEQRARWFGYKRAYLDICRIFLTQRLRGRYAELLQHEDDFWDALRRNERQGLNVRDWPRMFRLDANQWQLRPTRQAVANSRQFHGTAWETQRQPVEHPLRIRQNIDVVRSFFGSHVTEIRQVGTIRHLVVPNCPLESVISGLLARLDTEGTDWESAYVIEYLSRLLLGNRLTNMDVLLMTEGDPTQFRFRTRKTTDGRIDNPFQGRTPGRKPTDPLYYPGDDHIHNSLPQLQVHLVSVDGDSRPAPVETTALALFVPTDDRYDLRTVVRED